MSISNSTLAAQLSAMVAQWRDREVEFATWVNGEADGGPYGDGRYPLTDYLGNVEYVPCPAALVSGTTGSAASAGAAQAAAEAAQAAAEAAQASAEAASGSAAGYRDEAEAARDLAAAHRASAENYRSQAQAARSQAQAAAAAAEATAEGMEAALEDAATAAAAAATAAAEGHASDAASSAAAAASSASAASGYASAASGSASAAAGSASSASTSATNAAGSAASAGEAQAAAEAAQAAAEAAQTGAESASTSAAGYRDAAEAARDLADAHRASAENYRSQAASSASDAASSASAASGYASAASGSASAASGYASAASGHADDAEAAATAAASSASSAASSASSAASSASAAASSASSAASAAATAVSNLLAANNTWSGSNTFSGNLSVGGTISGSGAGITGVVHTTGTEAIGGIKQFTEPVYCRGDASYGYLKLDGGDVSHTGYLNFYAPNGNRQGYIGWSSTSASSDAGTIPYVAGAHAFTGNVTVSGSITGSGSGLTSLNASNISSGTLNDARLSSNVALKNAVNTWSDANQFTHSVLITGLNGGGSAALRISNALPRIRFTESDVSAENKEWYIYTNAGAFNITTVNGALSATKSVLLATRSGNAVSAVVYGNSTDNPSHTFHGAISGNGSGLTSLNASNISSGTIDDARLSSNVALKGAANTFTASATIRGATATFGGLQLTAGGASASGFVGFPSHTGFVRQGFIGNSPTNAAQDAGTIQYVAGTHAFTGNVTVSGSITGSGSGLTSLNASNLSSGTVSDARLSSNVPLKNASNTFTGGIQIGSPTGGDKGAGTLNTAGNIFLNNNPVPCIVSGGAAGGGRITISTSDPSGTPSDGDIWIKREA